MALAFLVSASTASGSAANPDPEPNKPLWPTQSELDRAFKTSKSRNWVVRPAKGPFTRTVQTTHAAPWDFRSARGIELTAKLKQALLEVVRLRWVLRSQLGGLYISAESTRIASAGPGTTLALSFASTESSLIPLGHQRPWDDMAAAEVLSIELRTEIPYPTASSIEIVLEQPKLLLPERIRITEKPRLLDMHLEKPPLDIEAAATLVFRIDPLPQDPFAVDGPGDVRVRYPDGSEILAFLDQPCQPRLDGQWIRYEALASPVYKAYLPRTPLSESLTIRSGEGHQWIIPGEAFKEQREVVSDLLRNGRIQAREELGTESPSGPRDRFLGERQATGSREQWFVPLEDNLAQRLAGLDAGIWGPAPRFWRLTVKDPVSWEVMNLPPLTTVWRPVLFWNSRWGQFGGLRRPSFVQAHRMDQTLIRAQEEGKSQALCLLDQEWFGTQGTFNWLSHPMNVGQGGNFSGPGQIFQSEEGILFCQRIMRYAIARWGRSRPVSSFLISVTKNVPGAPDLHARLAATAKSWPILAKGEKHLYSMHPMTTEPQVVKEVGRVEDGGGIAGGSWYAGDPLPAQLRYIPRIQGRWEAGSEVDLEVNAMAEHKSVSAIKPFRLAFVDYREVADDNFHEADALLFDVYLPSDAPPDLRAGVHLRDKNDLWYQALLPGLLNSGDWTTCVVDLTEKNAHHLKGMGHKKSWSAYSRGRLKEIGLHVYTTHPESRIKARFSRARAVRFDRFSKPAAPLLQILSSSKDISEAGQCWTCDIHINKSYDNPFDIRQVDLRAIIHTPSGKRVEIPAFFNQPCRRRQDPPGGAEIVEPVGTELWTVRYRIIEAGAHRVTFELREGGRFVVEDKRWVADSRFSQTGTPFQPHIRNKDDWDFLYPEYDQEGKRRVESLRYEAGPVVATLDLEGVAFSVQGRTPEWRGFIRPADDGRHLQYDDQSFYYALGPCLRSPSDDRRPYMNPKWNQAELDRISARGTYQYDDYLAAFQNAGINWTRIWMCSWWCGLEWRRDWPGYQGLGRYNLLNAWRLDQVIEACERTGVRVNLCLNNHGRVSRVIDTEWAHNPYSQRFGGPLDSATEFFTQADAKIFQMNFLRYVAARWGHSPSILTWELFSELEFTEEYRPSLPEHVGQTDHPAPHIETWHREMASWLKSVDPNRHMVATHYSHPVRGAGTFSLPQVEIAMSNAYSAFLELSNGEMDAAAALSDFWSGSTWNRNVFKGMRVFRKPVLVEEQGRHWMGVETTEHGAIMKINNTRENLDADLHCGLWGSVVQPLAGATGYWWWLHVHFDDRYTEYRALANFIKGEDFRANKERKESELEPELLTVQTAKNELLARARTSNRRSYIWVYHRTVSRMTDGFEPVMAAHLQIPQKLVAGSYRVEFWDTESGQMISSQGLSIEAPEPSRSKLLLLPTVKRDIAIKIKPTR